MKSNILYLTNACNLKCEYCYQRHDLNSLSVSEKEVHNFIKEIIEREGLKTTSTVVLFGGEPLLLKYKFFDILDIFESYDKSFALSTTTNGIQFLDAAFLNDFKDKISKLKNKFSLEISYDGSGHYRRVYPNGKSSESDIKKVLVAFDPNEISIRYTIHKGNYKNCIRDIIELQKYHKIIVNFYESELENFTNVKELKDKLQRVSEYLYTKFKTPICYLNCEFCQKCDFKSFSGINYQSKLSIDGNAENFKHFSLLKDLKNS